jgi:type IV secretory pathway VirB2 component (pilin)
MASLCLKNWIKKINISAMTFLIAMKSAYASSTTTSLPFNTAMNTLKDAISGPFLLAAAIIMIVVTCLMLAFGEWGDGFKKVINIVLWLSIAFGAASFVATMFGSGAVF